MQVDAEFFKSTHMTKKINTKSLTLFTCGGRILCQQCTAKSTRTNLQCGRPALKTSKNQKCQFHGGRSTGPKTEEGRLRIAKAQFKHGRETKKAREERSQGFARLLQLEDAMYLIGMTNAPKTRGRKPKGYKRLRTILEVKQILKK